MRSHIDKKVYSWYTFLIVKIMSHFKIKSMKKYRLGNQSEEYELRENYLGWIPEGGKNWENITFKNVKNTELTIINPDNQRKEIIFLHSSITKEAFPMNFFGEERSDKFSVFAIISETKTSEKFIIPLY